MGNLSLKIGWQVDDVDGTERTFLWTDTTTYTEPLGDVGYLGFWSDLNAKLACSDDWAGFLALLPTFLPRFSMILTCPVSE